MSDATQVLPWLWLGGKDAAKDLAFLSRSISTIVNLTALKTNDPAGVPNYYEAERRFRYIRVPLYDNNGQSFLPIVDRVLVEIERGRHYGSVLVHCAKGISRSASICACVLIQKHGFSVDAALAYLKELRPIISPNPAFMRQLMQFAQDTERHRKSGLLLPAEALPLLSEGPRRRPLQLENATARVGEHPSPKRARYYDTDQPDAAVDASTGSFCNKIVSLAGAPEEEQGRRGPVLDSSSLSAASSSSSSSSTSSAVVKEAEPASELHSAVSLSGVGGALNASTTEIDPGAEDAFVLPQGAPIATCEECDAAVAVLHCWECSVNYCCACDAEVHAISSIGAHSSARVPIQCGQGL